ncbi:5-formyltetrahydrofolate cyclo-ligase [Methylobacterium sp. BE186]|uniref:5-formyltetrahydrofolate cyclo-ligase n=1 Tax=Methylobacterium sp. BE186 TaxID=2817715 RepID=UPI00286150FA|nr:5-formyltetrahydrofolate cyclo-ligase [Methylobacterium sp. BE186]MDR7038573.1 5-formyltetrahydrofolate cyclo-ligase [Methylobacterium sp. BE186]
MGELSEDSRPGLEAPAEAPPAPGAEADWPTVRAWRKETRSALIAQRIALEAEMRLSASRRIDLALAQAVQATGRGLIGFYWPFRGEYDPRGVMAALREQGARLALPVIVAKGEPLAFREWTPGSLMTQGIWNIPTPEAGDPVQPELLVVPLVGFDGHGYRLGYGGGFYDRTIAAMTPRPRTIGVGFAIGRLETIRPQPHDIALDRVITDG